MKCDLSQLSLHFIGPNSTTSANILYLNDIQIEDTDISYLFGKGNYTGYYIYSNGLAIKNTVIGLNSINFVNVTNIAKLFSNSLIKSLTASDIDLSNAIGIGDIFNGCNELFALNLSNWNVSNLNELSCMCYNCSNLVDVTMDNWNVTNVISMGRMFTGCNNLSDASIDSIVNMCINAVNITYKNIRITNVYSPFYGTNITNTRYQNRWEELTAAGWTY